MLHFSHLMKLIDGRSSSWENSSKFSIDLNSAPSRQMLHSFTIFFSNHLAKKTNKIIFKFYFGLVHFVMYSKQKESNQEI